MKLRNKKTGEIAEPFGLTCVNGRTFVQFADEEETFKFEARSLAELNEDWEDYEEPKKYFEPALIDNNIVALIVDKKTCREEAEKAVEKLKAWKRLKDKCNIRFTGINRDSMGRPVSVNLDFDRHARSTFDDAKQSIEDLLLLFGGDE